MMGGFLVFVYYFYIYLFIFFSVTGLTENKERVINMKINLYKDLMVCTPHLLIDALGMYPIAQRS